MKTGTSPLKSPRQASRLVLTVGTSLHLITALFLANGGGIVFRTALCAWSLAPYLLLALALQRSKNCGALLAGALLMLLLDAHTYWSVFVAPQSSTAALGLLMAPLFNLFCMAPLSIAANMWLGHRRS
ncbi:hypothetical protein O0882_11620 [Janthinobacterium sp. SUN073]|uniref:hypothetical protein n=1 Tax=Janthinobacterium sp. SUN073 TaxID=3004102 RepID=UPI0025AF864F|nr:hypothetical protein [Janthinobacterium sp. SUN073]MDN2696968.1 hypothetical protein [Janthinobacterium sp. SUN073]